MAIFAIIAQPGANAEKLPGAIARAYPSANLQLHEKAWLVAAKGTSKEVSDNLGVTDGSNGSAVILETQSYFGRANPNIWSWIKTQWEATANG